MQSKYLVLTPWGGQREDLLEQCKASVATSPYEHRVVKCGSDWEEVMFSMRNDAEYVAYVDADDIVYPGALEAVFSALENNDVGLAFTKEQRITEDGTPKEIRPHAKNIKDVISEPSKCHHLVAMRRNSIDDEPMRVYRKFANFESKNRGCPLDWLMRARSATQCGFIHVDMVGYGYRMHRDTITLDRDFFSHFAKILFDVRKEISTW